MIVRRGDEERKAADATARTHRTTRIKVTGATSLMRFTAFPCCHFANRYCIQNAPVKPFAKMA
jgi:SET domain-containing protein